jgi:hypothetical protein
MSPAEEFHEIWIRGHAARIIDQLSSGEPRRHADEILERVKNFLEHESFEAPAPKKAKRKAAA